MQKCGLAGLRAKFEISQVHVLIGSVLIRRKFFMTRRERAGCMSNARLALSILLDGSQLDFPDTRIPVLSSAQCTYVQMWHVGYLEVA